MKSVISDGARCCCACCTGTSIVTNRSSRAPDRKCSCHFDRSSVFDLDENDISQADELQPHSHLRFHRSLIDDKNNRGTEERNCFRTFLCRGQVTKTQDGRARHTEICSLLCMWLRIKPNQTIFLLFSYMFFLSFFLSLV